MSHPENITPIKYDSSWHASPTSTMKNDDINKLHEVHDQQVQHGEAINKKSELLWISFLQQKVFTYLFKVFFFK